MLVPNQTTTQMPEPAPLKRCAIIGTAESWKDCPWEDKTLEVWGLNDAYLIGVPRANRWYDLHPVHQMNFQEPGTHAVTLPQIGVYYRPYQHLEWLRSRPMPVIMAEPHPAVPNAQVFPQQAILDFFKDFWPYRINRQGQVRQGDDYEVSTPSWMLMHAIVEGYKEIHVYGIHLQTEWEYVQQRPNFEYLLGIARGLGAKIVLPESTPICKAAYRYAFEPKADLPIQEIDRAIQIIKEKGLRLQQARAALKWYERGRRTEIDQQLAVLNAQLADKRQELSRAQVILRER